MDLPSWLLGIAREAAANNGDSVEDATDAALARAREHEEFDALVDDLVSSAVRHLIYDARHKDNVQARRDAGDYGQPPKVASITKETVKVARSVYLYYVGGRTLGELRGADLPGLANGERARAAGHDFNARLLEALQPLVKEDRTVRECVSEKKLQRIFRGLDKAAA